MSARAGASAAPARLASEDDARDNLDALIRQRGERHEPLSRMLGRRGNYLRKWIGGANDDRLVDEERYRLAAHFDVDARVLGAPDRAPPAPPGRPAGRKPQRASA